MDHMTRTLIWKRDDFGNYADSPTDPIRYYARREGRKWTLEAVPTIEIAGIRTVKPGTNPRWIDRHNDTLGLCKAIAEAYEIEPERPPLGKATRRLTRAIDRAYRNEEG